MLLAPEKRSDPGMKLPHKRIAVGAGGPAAAPAPFALRLASDAVLAPAEAAPSPITSPAAHSADFTVNIRFNVNLPQGCMYWSLPPADGTQNLAGSAPDRVPRV